MASKVSVGIVGNSGFAEWVHIPSVKHHPQAVLSAICGRNRTRDEELAAKYDIPQIFTDYHELIARGKLDAVIVVTPDDLHYPITMEALNAGLHVLCEKPLAYNASQAGEMYEKAQAVGVKHMVHFTYRWMPIFRYTKQLLDEGYIGQPYQCSLLYLNGGHKSTEYRWRFDRQRSHGALGDLGSHMIDLGRWLLGDISRVSGQLAYLVDRSNLDVPNFVPSNDAAMINLQFQNGTQGVIQLNTVAQVEKSRQVQQVVFYGEQGTLDVTFSFNSEKMQALRVGEEQFHPVPIPDEMWGGAARGNLEDYLEDLFYTQSVGARSFIDAILEDRPATPSFYDGYQAQVVMDAVNESHEKGIWVELE